MPDKENYGRRKTDRIDANISRKYKGKEYSLIDIQNLIDANAQLAETIRNREKFIKQQEEILKNEGKLSHQQQVMYTSALEANKKAQEQLNQNDKRVTELTDNWNRYITDTMKNPSNSSDVMKSIIQQSNSNNKPMPKSISDLFRQSLTDVQTAFGNPSHPLKDGVQPLLLIKSSHSLSNSLVVIPGLINGFMY